MKNIKKRYLSEDYVKRALKIKSFRNISKEKIMKFASIIPYTDKEVAISIINQFPVFADFGKTAVDIYMKECDSILSMNNDSVTMVIEGYKTILEGLSKRISSENITEEERKSITEDMIFVADKIAEVDLQNKKFLEKMATKVLFGFLGVAALVGAGIGINSAIGNGNQVPQLDEDDDLEEDELEM